MMLKVTYARGDHYHITGNEEVVTEIMTEEEFLKIQYKHEIILCNVTRAD